MNSIQKSRVFYADVLRVLAAFLVVLQHSVSFDWAQVPVQTSEWITLNFFNALSRYGVGIFVMISGAFMLSPLIPQSTEKIIKIKIPKMFFILILWVLIYGIVNNFLYAETLIEWLKTPLLLFTAPATHLWYLYMIIGLYLLTPIFRIITQNATKKQIEYLLAILFLAGFCLPTLSFLLKEYWGVHLYSNIKIQGTTSFIAFYFAGYYFSHYPFSNIFKRIIYILGLLSLAFTFGISSYLSIQKGVATEYFFGNFRPTIFLTAIMIFLSVRSFFEARNIPRYFEKMIMFITPLTLGIYLIHPLLLKPYYALRSEDFLHPIFLIPCISIFIFALSSLCICFFKKSCAFFLKNKS